MIIRFSPHAWLEQYEAMEEVASNEVQELEMRGEDGDIWS
jgi:hypothetical protein